MATLTLTNIRAHNIHPGTTAHITGKSHTYAVFCVDGKVEKATSVLDGEALANCVWNDTLTLELPSTAGELKVRCARAPAAAACLAPGPRDCGRSAGYAELPVLPHAGDAEARHLLLYFSTSPAAAQRLVQSAWAHGAGLNACCQHHVLDAAL